MKRRPSEARVCLFYSISLSLCYRPIEDYFIYSYESHLNIKEEFILGFFSRKGFPKENFVSLVYALYFIVHFSYWLYTCSLVNALGYTIDYSIKLKDIHIV